MKENCRDGNHSSFVLVLQLVDYLPKCENLKPNLWHFIHIDPWWKIPKWF